MATGNIDSTPPASPDQPRARPVTTGRERLEQLGGVAPAEDDGTPAQNPVHATFEGSEAEVQLLISDLASRTDVSGYSERRLRIDATAPRLPNVTRAEWRGMFADLAPATDDDLPWQFPVRTPLIDERPGVRP